MASRSQAALPLRPGARASSLSSLQQRASPAASIGEQIRQLELEGSVLRAQVDDILADVDVGHDGADAGAGYSSRPRSRARSREHSRSPQLQRSSSVDAILAAGQQQSQAAGNYSHLADSSEEQREIEAMSSRLSAQAAAAASQLQQSLRSASPCGRGLSRTEILLPPASAERELRETQEQLQYARNQLRAAHERQQREKAELRSQLDGLRSRLHEAQSARDSATAQRSREASAQEELVARLQQSLRCLQQANQEQERALLDTNERLDASKRRQFAVEAVLADVRALMADVEARQGRSFVGDKSAALHEPHALPNVIEACLQEYTSEIEDRTKDILTLERELSDSRQAFLQEREELERSWKSRCEEVKEEYELELRRAKDRSLDDQRLAESLGGSVRQLEEQLRSQSEAKASRVQELEAALAKVIDDYDSDRKSWESKRGGLESALDESQKELAATKAQRDESARSSALLETQVTSLEQEASELKAEVAELKAETEEERRGREEAEARLQEAEEAADSVREQLSAKAEEAAELLALVRTLKEETDDITRQQVTRALAEEKQQSSAQAQAMSANASRLAERNELLAKELHAVRLDLSALDCRQRALADEKLAAERQLEAERRESRRAAELLAKRDAELRRLTEERDFYYAELSDKSDRLAAVTADYRRLLQLFEEKSAQLASLEHDDVDDDDEQPATRQLAAEEAKLGREAVARRLRGRDQRLRDALLQRDRLRAELDARQSEKESLYLELKDSRLEVAALREEAEAAKAGGRREKESLEAKVSELSGRARDLKRQLGLAKDALRTKESLPKPRDSLRPREAPAKAAGGRGGKRGMLDAANRQVQQLRERLAEAERREETLRTEKCRLSELGRQAQRQNEQLLRQLDARARQCREAANCKRQLRAANEKLRCRLAAGGRQQRPEPDIQSALHDIQRMLRQSAGKQRIDASASDGELPPRDSLASCRSSPVEDLLSANGHSRTEEAEHRQLDDRLQQLSELGSQLRKETQQAVNQVQQQAERLQTQ